MKITYIDPNSDLSAIVRVLNKAHGTVAREFNFTRENNPSNNAFIDAATLKTQLESGIDLYTLSADGSPVACIAIEKSAKEEDTYYIEKVSVLPEYRNRGMGIQLMNFGLTKIRELGGITVSIALIDSNEKLKNWYLKQGFTITGVKDFERLPFRVCFMNKWV